MKHTYPGWQASFYRSFPDLDGFAVVREDDDGVVWEVCYGTKTASGRVYDVKLAIMIVEAIAAGQPLTIQQNLNP